jgi:hypothetical protein
LLVGSKTVSEGRPCERCPKKSDVTASDQAIAHPWYHRGSSTRTAVSLVTRLVVVASVAGPVVVSVTMSQPADDSILAALMKQLNSITVSPSPGVVGYSMDLGVGSRLS